MVFIIVCKGPKLGFCVGCCQGMDGVGTVNLPHRLYISTCCQALRPMTVALMVTIKPCHVFRVRGGLRYNPCLVRPLVLYIGSPRVKACCTYRSVVHGPPGLFMNDPVHIAVGLLTLP